MVLKNSIVWLCFFPLMLLINPVFPLQYLGHITNSDLGLDGLDGARSIVMSPDEKFVYVAAFRDEAISYFSRDELTGTLQYMGLVKNGVGGVEGIGGISEIVMSPDGLFLYAAAYSDNSLACFARDPVSGGLSFRAKIQDYNSIPGLALSGVTNLALSPNAKHLYAISGYEDAVNWFTRDTETGELVFSGSLKGDTLSDNYLNDVNDITLSPNGQYTYLTASTDSSVSWFLRDTVSGTLTYHGTIRATDPGINGMVYPNNILISPDGKHAYVLASDNTVAWFMVDEKTGALTFNGYLKDGINGVDGLYYPGSLVLSSDGEFLYIGSDEDAIAWFRRDLASGALNYMGIIESYTPGVKSLDSPEGLVMSADNGYLYFASDNGKAVGWLKVNAGGGLTFLDRIRDTYGLNGASAVSVSPDDKHVYVLASKDNALSWFTFNNQAGTLSYAGSIMDGENGMDGIYGVVDMIFSNNGRQAYTVYYNGINWFNRNTTSGALTFLNTIYKYNPGVDGLDGARKLTLTHDQKFVYVAANYDNAVSWFSRDINTGNLTYSGNIKDAQSGVNGLNGAVDLMISPDDRFLYVLGIYDTSISWFSRNTSNGGLTYEGSIFDHDSGVKGLSGCQSLALSPDGRHVYVAALYDNSVSWFSRDSLTGSLAYSGTVIDNINGVDGLYYANSVVVHPSGYYVFVSADYDDAVSGFMRDPVSGDLAYSGVIKDNTNGTDGLESVKEIALSGSGNYLFAAAYGDNAVSWFKRTQFNFIPVILEEKGLYKSDLQWVDMDNDQYLDLISLGKNQDNDMLTTLYQNQAGRGFIPQQSLLGLYSGAIAAADVDEDRDMDLVVLGNQSASGIIAKSALYENNSVSLEQPRFNVDSLYESDALFLDYDNDGDQDLVLAGKDNAGQLKTLVYANQNGQFSGDTSQSLTGVTEAALACGDVDNDLDMDLLVCGLSGSGLTARLYRNDNSRFIFWQNLQGISEGDAEFADYDNDGDLDLILAGNSLPEVTILYDNDGSGNLAPHSGQTLVPVYNGSLAWVIMMWTGIWT